MHAGLFFYERINTYFGGRALGFAAALGDSVMLDYLISDARADLHFVDHGCLATYNNRVNDPDGVEGEVASHVLALLKQK